MEVHQAAQSGRWFTWRGRDFLSLSLPLTLDFFAGVTL